MECLAGAHYGSSDHGCANPGVWLLCRVPQPTSFLAVFLREPLAEPSSILLQEDQITGPRFGQVSDF